MGGLHWQPCRDAVYSHLEYVSVTMAMHRYTENPFVSRFSDGSYFGFLQWWNPERFDWAYSGCLARFYPDYFERWWDPQRYNWQSSGALIRNCHQYFHIWWDAERFDWKPRSVRLLMKYCKEHFESWWDAEAFPWKTNVIYLVRDFTEKFNIWWDENKFPWGKKFGSVSIEEMLISRCSDHLPIWYRSKAFHLTDKLCELLKSHCGQYRDIWARDYLLHKLAK
ncbi:MAG: hypothetical protein J7J91_10350 [Deltaproteobacteria bacterium]|nr:hypothetical protein [Deltaproteobacteria bacterium]